MNSTYLLDGEAVNWQHLIETACGLDDTYRNSVIKTTSRAAEILRQHGYSVEEKPACATN